jgi:anti-anti-sigma factor
MLDPAIALAAGTLSIDREQSDSVLWLRLAGEIDCSNCHCLSDQLDLLDPGTTTLIFDLRGVTFIDSVGLQALLEAQRRCEAEDVHLTLIGGADVERLLVLVGLDRRFDLVENEHQL